MFYVKEKVKLYLIDLFEVFLFLMEYFVYVEF